MSNGRDPRRWTPKQIAGLALIAWLVVIIAAVLLWRYLGG